MAEKKQPKQPSIKSTDQDKPRQNSGTQSPNWSSDASCGLSSRRVVITATLPYSSGSLTSGIGHSNGISQTV